MRARKTQPAETMSYSASHPAITTRPFVKRNEASYACLGLMFLRKMTLTLY